MYRFRSHPALLMLVVAVSSLTFVSSAVAEDSTPAVPSLVQPPAQDPAQLAAGRNLVRNGSFETGDFTSWKTTDMPTPLMAWNVNTVLPPGIGPVPDGTYFARNGFDGGGPGSYVIWQKVRIPARGKWRLTWRDSFVVNLAPGAEPRSQYVEILTPKGKLLKRVYKYSTPPGPLAVTIDWEKHVASLAKFGGTRVLVSFRQYVPQAFTGPGMFQLDDIRIAKKG